MSWFSKSDDHANAYNQVQNSPHKAHLSHEVIAAAAAYEAEKSYISHCEKNGKPQSHQKAKEILAGLAGVAVTRIVETKGLDFIDKQKAKNHAQKHIDDNVHEHNYDKY